MQNFGSTKVCVLMKILCTLVEDQLYSKLLIVGRLQFLFNGFLTTCPRVGDGKWTICGVTHVHITYKYRPWWLTGFCVHSIETHFSLFVDDCVTNQLKNHTDNGHEIKIIIQLLDGPLSQLLEG